MLQGAGTKLASKAAALVSTKWQRRIHQTIGVDPYRAGLQEPGNAVSFLHVARPDCRGQPVRIAVRLLDDFVHVVKGEHRQHWTEDLFTSNGHVVLHIAEDRRFDKKSFTAVDRDPRAASHQ